jgi:hypothetical protein
LCFTVGGSIREEYHYTNTLYNIHRVADLLK